MWPSGKYKIIKLWIFLGLKSPNLFRLQNISLLILQIMSSSKQQKSFTQQVISHPHFRHFLVYSLSYILFGQVITCLGPMFPYLAEDQGRVQTEYSFLFVCRAVGFISGSVIMRFLGQRFTLHQYIGVGVVLMSVFSILFGTVESLSLKGACIYFSSIGGSFQDVTINLAALDCFKGQNLSKWLQSIHGSFGIGGLLGPFVVYIFQLNSLLVLGTLSILSIIFYYRLQTPQKFTDLKKMQQQDMKIQELPSASIYLISAGFLFAVGQQVSYGGWISSYAVLYKFSTKQHATFYSSLYWISITFFRFALAMVTGSPSNKIKNLGFIGIGTTFLGYILIFHVNSQFGLIIMSILFGLTNSVLFPLLLTIAQEFGYKLTIKQNTVFIIWASLGQGCLAVVVGKFMQWISYNWLLYSVGLMNVALVVVMHLNYNLLSQAKSSKNQQGNLQRLVDDYKTGQNADYGSIGIVKGKGEKIFQMKNVAK